MELFLCSPSFAAYKYIYGTIFKGTILLVDVYNILTNLLPKEISPSFAVY